MTIVRRLLTVAFVVVLLAVLASATLLGTIVVRGFPQRDGTAELAGLTAPVEVIRDANGIPQVYADSAVDLFMAQGWLHASERMWQMEVWRRIGAGRLSELFGESQLETDTFIRTLGWRRAAERDQAGLGPQVRGYLDAYAAGVNAWLETHRDLPLPFVIAGALGAGGGLSGFQPEPWTALDTLTWQKVQAWDLGANWEAELFRMLAEQRLDPGRVAQLFPAYPDDRPVIVPCGLPGAGGAAATCQPGQTSRGEGPVARSEPPVASVPAVSSSGRTAPSIGRASAIDVAGLARLRSITARVRGLAGLGSGAPGPIGSGGLGSNSWAVAPSRSATGAALLANDPHLGVSMPSVWYLIGLHCRTQSEACPFDMAGAGFPGVPGLVLGHNDRIAWGLTNVGPDVQDLVIERVAADASAYQTPDGTRPFDVRTETIEVAGGEPVSVTVRESVHGPIISDVVGALQPVEEDGGGLSVGPDQVLALQWTALADEDHTIEAILGVNLARDWDEFREALRSFGAPAQTFLYADVDGHIGLQVPGAYPVRGGGDGGVPLPGTDPDSTWNGRVPYDELPWIHDPPSGSIVTANNAPVEAAYPWFLGGQWDPGYRSARISERLGDATGSLAELGAIQGDAMLTRAAALADALDDARASTADGEAVLAAIRAWADAETPFGCGTASPGCAAYEAYELALLRGLYDDELGGTGQPDDLAPMYVGSDASREALRALLETPDDAWWDDVTTTDLREDRDAIVTRALDQAGAWLREALGEPTSWRWGDLHQVTFREQTLGESGIAPLEWIFDRGPFAASGSCDTLDARCGSLSAIYPDPDDGAVAVPLADAFAVSNHPSYRLLADLGDLDASTIIQSTGQSGVPFDEHYGDWIDEWLAVESVPLPFSRAAVEAAGTRTLTLAP